MPQLKRWLLKDIKQNTQIDKNQDDEEIRFIRITDDEEEEKEYDVSGRSAEVQKVCAVYPYLNPDFVEAKLAEAPLLNEKYPPETLLSISHRVHFKDTDAAEKFTEIMEDEGYICVDRTDVDISATKNLFAEDNAITDDVLNAAGQAAALRGVYDGFEIN